MQYRIAQQIFIIVSIISSTCSPHSLNAVICILLIHLFVLHLATLMPSTAHISHIMIYSTINLFCSLQHLRLLNIGWVKVIFDKSHISCRVGKISFELWQQRFFRVAAIAVSPRFHQVRKMMGIFQTAAAWCWCRCFRCSEEFLCRCWHSLIVLDYRSRWVVDEMGRMIVGWLLLWKLPHMTWIDDKWHVVKLKTSIVLVNLDRNIHGVYVRTL